MKPSTSFIILIFSVLFHTSFLPAQVKPNQRMSSFGPQPALEVSLPDAGKDLIIDVWKQSLRPYGKVKRNRKAGEYYLEKAIVSPIDAARELNIYLIPDEGEAVVFIDLQNHFLQEGDQEYSNAVAFLQSFATDVEKERLHRWIKQEEKKLKSLNKQYSKLTKREKKLKGRIESAKNTIKESEEELQQNVQKQKEQLESIDKQRQHIKDLEEQLNQLKH